MTDSAKPAPPETEQLKLWRTACVAYRAARRRGAGHPDAIGEASAAVQVEAPDFGEAAAAGTAAQAVTWCSVTHTAWFWDGVGELRRTPVV